MYYKSPLTAKIIMIEISIISTIKVKVIMCNYCEESDYGERVRKW